MDDVEGVDVSKADLKVFRLHGNVRLCVSNDRVGFVKLRDWLGPTHPQLIVFEVTGAYHRSLESFLYESELPCTKVLSRLLLVLMLAPDKTTAVIRAR